MITFKRLDHVLITVPTGKIEDARRFYAQELELEEIPGKHPNGAIWFKTGDIQLHIREEAGGNYSDRHPAFEVENLEEARKFLAEKGITLHYSSLIEGRERFFFRDPFGNRFELIAYL